MTKRKLKPVPIRTIEDVEGCILRFSLAWQEPVSNTEIRPVSNDLLVAAEWMRDRISGLEHGLREASERFDWLARFHLNGEFSKKAAKDLATKYWELQAPPKRSRMGKTGGES